MNYIHSKQIIHRDIKPENILFENDGYLRITDMGIAKIFRPNNNSDTSGTPGYMGKQLILPEKRKQWAMLLINDMIRKRETGIKMDIIQLKQLVLKNQVSDWY